MSNKRRLILNNKHNRERDSSRNIMEDYRTQDLRPNQRQDLTPHNFAPCGFCGGSGMYHKNGEIPGTPPAPCPCNCRDCQKR